MKKTTLLLLTALLLSGCATNYQKKGFWGDGFSETRLNENVFQVSFKGNSSTDKERVQDFALLRSAELALKNGYKYFVIVESKDSDTYSTFTTPIKAQTESSGYSNGISRHERKLTTVSGGDTHVYVSPGKVNTIICYHEKPNVELSYNAQIIRNSIKTKYQLTA